MIAEIIDLISVITFLAASAIFLYIIVKYYKGMKTPPFWIYVFAAFLLVTFVNVLDFVPKMIDEMILKIIKAVGYLLFLVGVLELFRSYKSRIKFDEE